LRVIRLLLHFIPLLKRVWHVVRQGLGRGRELRLLRAASQRPFHASGKLPSLVL